MDVTPTPTRPTARTSRRRRGATSLAALALIGGVLTGCGDRSAPASSGEVSDTGTSSDTPAPATADPATSTSPSGSDGALTEVPADFPLDEGLPADNGDDGSPVEVVETPGWEDFELCGTVLWSPGAPVPTTDVAGATYTGEAEDVRTRSLAVYASAADAADALSRLRDGIAGCPDGQVGGTEQVYEEVSGDDGSATFTHRYRTDGRFDTGLEVIQAVQRGNALFLAGYYGEGGGSASTIRSAIELAAEESAGVIEALAVFEPTADQDAPSTDPGTPPTTTDEDLADFPLGEGWPTGLTEDGDDGREGPGPRVDPVALEPCGEAADTSAVSDSVHASYSNAEDYRRRSLLVFPSADDAVAYVAGARRLVLACPVDDTTDDGFDYRWSVRDTRVGGQSFAAINNNAYEGSPGIYLYAVHVVRVGRAVLLDSVSNEGGGTTAAHDAAVEAMTRESATVVAAMCRFTEAGC